MKYWYGDLIKEKLGKDEKCCICITTNGFVKSNGEAVMGRGIAKSIADQRPKIKKKLGELLKTIGNQVHILGVVNNTVIITFPVKPISMEILAPDDFNYIVNHMKNKFKYDDKVPGWACKADIDIIKKSIRELTDVTKKFGIPVYLPKPGCGAGELQWSDVKSVIEEYCHENIIICDFKGV